MSPFWKTHAARWFLPISLLVVMLVYWPGLEGYWLFDDYPNIVDNPGVQPHDVSVPALVRAALSSPASDFKRPLASFSFAANYLIGGLDPFGWKLANLVIHLLNGVLVFILARLLLAAADVDTPTKHHAKAHNEALLATLISASWMLLPINLTSVLYVVQREESLANFFVLAGLIGYVTARRQMLALAIATCDDKSSTRDFWLCVASLVIPTALGLLAKETAVMLPLYAFLIEWIVFDFGRKHSVSTNKRIIGLFVLVLILPMAAGLAWQIPHVLNSANWATRDFTLGQRLLSEARVVCDYLAWTIVPTPGALSFYHDDFAISTGPLAPWTTLTSLLVLAALVVLIFRLRRQRPLVSLGIALFLGCQLLTGTILQLELVYEHRNYFASFGVMLALIPWLAGATVKLAPTIASADDSTKKTIWLGPAVIATLMLWWAGLTTGTAYAWGDALRLAQELAARAPHSPRAQYELGRTYIIYSHYDRTSPYTRLAYAPLEKAASFPASSILPQQALIFMNSRMGLPLRPQWWDSMIAKLNAKKPGVQDESSLAALVQCNRDEACALPVDRMTQAFEAALSHPQPSARLQAIYSDYAWNILRDRALGLRMIEGAVTKAPSEPSYRITLVRMLTTLGNRAEAETQMRALQNLNFGGRLNAAIDGLSQQIMVNPASPQT
jgi:hypothetical protein